MVCHFVERVSDQRRRRSFGLSPSRPQARTGHRRPAEPTDDRPRLGMATSVSCRWVRVFVAGVDPPVGTYHGYTHTHGHTRTHTYTHARARARTHTHAHARARAHTHTHTCAHTQSVFYRWVRGLVAGVAPPAPLCLAQSIRHAPTTVFGGARRVTQITFFGMAALAGPLTPLPSPFLPFPPPSTSIGERLGVCVCV
jgi:hypothetical protein